MITDINATLRMHRETLEGIKILREIRVGEVSKYKLPIPRKWHGGRKYKYRWDSLKVDQNFLVPCADNWVARKRVMNSLTSCIANVRAKTGKRFSQRTDPRGVRVWRIE